MLAPGEYHPDEAPGELARGRGERVNWVLIPARGGSQGVPRKNLRLIGKRPLIAYSIRTALRVVGPAQTIVVTDSDEIAAVAVMTGAAVILEDQATPATETLDEKVLRNIPVLRERGAKNDDVVLTFQPTSPLLSEATLRSALAMFESPGVDCVLSVTDDRHLRWNVTGSKAVPAYRDRLNRQQLPPEYRETGGVIAARLGAIEREHTRVHGEVRLLQLSYDESIDIDTHADLYAAAHFLTRKKIAVRVDAARELGMGHVYRALALVTELARHQVRVYLSEDKPLGLQFFADKPYHVETISDHAEFAQSMHEWSPDLIVLDVLDTEADQVAALRSAAPYSRIVSFEDRGAGAALVDLVVAEFVTVEGIPPDRLVSGIDFALLSPSFELPIIARAPGKPLVDEVLILFGGTDPSGLAIRALNSLERVGYRGNVTVVRGLGSTPLEVETETLPFGLEIVTNVTNMPQLMARADFAFTSAGRTIIELAAVGVPSICIAQNDKELSHQHSVIENGVRMLGLGNEVSDDTLDVAVRTMLDNAQERHALESAAAAAGRRRSNQRTIAEIFDRVDLGTFPNL